MQELFDKICTGLASQNWERSMLDEVTGAYRSPDGLKCSIGWLISDEQYSHRFEQYSVRKLPLDLLEDIVGGPLTEDVWDFLIEVQELHDYTIMNSDLKFAFKTYAKNNNLKWSFQ